MSQDFRLLMLGAMYENGGNTTHRFLDGHPELFVYPFESQIGTRLVQECDRFARQAGYRRIRLWTQSMLTPARRVYERDGYRLVSEEPHHSFGHDLVGEIWEKTLA